MNDLEKMKADFAKKLEMAKVENEMEERFGIHFQVLDMLRGDGLRIIARGGEGSVVSAKLTSRQDAATLCENLICR
jgi:hypothetical protein